MKEPQVIKVASSWEYDYLVQRGYEPLMGYEGSINALFEIEHKLRRELQEAKFPNLTKFYKTAFALSSKICEETGMAIQCYSASNISHILSRGAHIAMQYDLRNYNLLILQAHNQWEQGDRKSMKIWPKNEILMEKLNLEYYG